MPFCGTRIKKTVLLLTGYVVMCGSVAATSDDDVSALETVAEKSDYRATSRGVEVDRFLETVAKHSDDIKLLNFGKTFEGRVLKAAVVARPAISTPKELEDDDRLVVVVLANIHSGECCGKEAVLAMLRDWAADEIPDWLDDLVLIMIPNFNADANEQVARDNRPGQWGPTDGMGLRANAQGLDLNREFIKLESPEVRALVQLINDWDPHLLIDLHTTNGSWHRYQLTYDIPHNPATPAAIRRLMREKIMPGVTESLADCDIDVYYYGNFDRQHTRWTTYGHQPRYGVEYVGLRGRLAILSEAYSYIPYRRRIEVTRAFAEQCLRQTVACRDEVRDVLQKTRTEAINADSQSERHGMGDEITIGAEVTLFAEKVSIKGYEPSTLPRRKIGVTGEELAAMRPKDLEVDFYGDYRATKSVPRAVAYLISPEHTAIAKQLRLHGIQVEEVVDEIEAEVEIYHIEKTELASRTWQGHRLRKVDVTKRIARRAIAKGTYVVNTAQPLGTLATYMLEPASDDGLLTWNFFDPEIRVGRDFPVWRRRPPMQVAGVPAIDILRRLGAKQEKGATAKEIDDYSRHFDRTDLNGDGKHTRVEYVDKGMYLTSQARSGIFRAADGNADGVVTKDEYILNRIITDEAKLIVGEADADKDGLVERAEFIGYATKLLSDGKLAESVYAALDSNADGQILLPEYLRVWGRWARDGQTPAKKRLRTREAELARATGN